jgi:hypothetical protein
MDVRPGGILSIDIATADGQEVPNLGCFLEVIPMARLVWTSMLFPGYRPAVFDDIPITAIVSMEAVGTGTRYVFTALHRDEADCEKNKTSGFQQGTEIAVDQFVEHVNAMKWPSAIRGGRQQPRLANTPTGQKKLWRFAVRKDAVVETSACVTGRLRESRLDRGECPLIPRA